MKSAACLLGSLTLGACSVQFHDVSQQSNVRQPSQRTYWGSLPAGALYVCLSVDPGVPVTQDPGQGLVLGYTRNVVALYGQLQYGDYIRIVHYTGALGWISTRTVRRYHGQRPNSTCIVPGVDMLQRPVFQISSR